MSKEIEITFHRNIILVCWVSSRIFTLKKPPDSLVRSTGITDSVLRRPGQLNLH